MSRMPNRSRLPALGLYLLIPAAMIGGAALAHLIDPEMARHSADYVRNYRLLELVQQVALMATAGLTLVLWVGTCYLTLKSRQRSLFWLLLAVAGPLGFIVIAMLEDRAPARDDRYQRFVAGLKMYWRAPLEIAVFFSSWFLAFSGVALKGELLIRYESFTTGTPVATIIDRQNASSGMVAFGEALEACYLVVLIYLLWPIVFNLVGRIFRAAQRSS